MLKDEDRIFTNLYGWMDSGLAGAKKRGDWQNTAKLLQRHHYQAPLLRCTHCGHNTLIFEQCSNLFGKLARCNVGQFN